MRLLRRQLLVSQVERLLEVLREYRRGWSDDAATRAERRDAVTPDLPAIDWIWQAIERSRDWIKQETLDRAWQGRIPA